MNTLYFLFGVVFGLQFIFYGGSWFDMVLYVYLSLSALILDVYLLKRI